MCVLFNITDQQTAAIVFGTIFITDIIKYNRYNPLSQGLVVFFYYTQYHSDLEWALGVV